MLTMPRKKQSYDINICTNKKQYKIINADKRLQLNNNEKKDSIWLMNWLLKSHTRHFEVINFED